MVCLLNSFVCNLGPQHPSTHGVLRLITILHGEVIKWLQVEVGLLHRGTEKLIEYHGFNQVIGVMHGKLIVSPP